MSRMMSYTLHNASAIRAAAILLVIVVIIQSNNNNSFLVSSFTIRTPISTYHHAISRHKSSITITTAHRIASSLLWPPSSASKSSRLHSTAASQSSQSSSITTDATLSYLNTLQSITSNPQLFPATSNSIEALIALQQRQQQQKVSVGNYNSNGLEENVTNNNISPREFLMNLSTELLRATTTSPSTITKPIDVTNDGINSKSDDENEGSTTNNHHHSHIVNLISEGMTAEEAAQVRKSRFQSTSVENMNVSNENMAGSSSNNSFGSSITEGMTAEEAQHVRIKRVMEHASSVALSRTKAAETTTSLVTPPAGNVIEKGNLEDGGGATPIINKSTDGAATSATTSTFSSRPTTNGRGGLAEVAATASSPFPKFPSGPTTAASSSSSPFSTTNEEWSMDTSSPQSSSIDNEASLENIVTNSNSGYNEISDSTNQPSPKTHKIPGTTIELTTPQISTPIGAVSGLLTYELIDEYAYQFNTWHNDIMIDKMKREDEIATMWNDMLGNFGVRDAVSAAAASGDGGGEGSVLTEALSVEKDALLEPAAPTSTDSSTTTSISIPEAPLNGAYGQQQEAAVDTTPTTAAPASVELHDNSMADETATSSTQQLSDVSSSETSVAAQSSSPISSSSLNEVVSVNEGNIMNAPTITTSSFDGGNTDLMTDVITAAPPTVTESTQYSDATGVINGGGMDVHAPVGATQYSDGQFGSPASTSELYSQPASSATVDQNSFNSFDSGSNSGSFASESFSRWHNEASGSNPLRDLASSLPPPIERIRGTGGDYSEAVSSQFEGTQDMATATAPPSGVDALVDSLSSSDLSNAPDIGDVGASVTPIPSDVSDSFTTQPPDASYDHLFESTEKLKSNIFSNQPEVHMDSIQDKVDATVNSQQSNALSDFASSSGTSMNDALISVKENGAAKLGSLLGSASHSLGEIQDKMVSAGASSMRGLGNAAHSMGTSTLPSSLSNVDLDVTQSAQQIGDALHPFHSPTGFSSAIQHVNDATLSDIGNGIMDAVKFMSGILLTAVDANLDLAVPGSSSASVLQNVRSSVTSMLDNASYTVSSVMNDIGNLTLKDIVHNLMVLIVATADVLMKIMNAVIYVISGKDSSGWALQATGVVDQATSQLLAQADDVTHRSFGDLAVSIGEYSHHVGDELIGLLGSFNGVEGVDSTLDVVTSTIQTGLSL